MTTRFIPREKMSKKARKLLDGQKRSGWGLSPVTRRVESKKKYTRKGKSHDDETAWDFFDRENDLIRLAAARQATFP